MHAQRRCYEVFEVGMVLRHSVGRTLTATDNAWLSLLFCVTINGLQERSNSTRITA